MYEVYIRGVVYEVYICDVIYAVCMRSVVYEVCICGVCLRHGVVNEVGVRDVVCMWGGIHSVVHGVKPREQMP